MSKRAERGIHPLDLVSPHDASILTTLAQFVSNWTHDWDDPKVRNAPQVMRVAKRMLGLYEDLSPGAPRQVARELLNRAAIDVEKLGDAGEAGSQELVADLSRKMVHWAGLKSG